MRAMDEECRKQLAETILPLPDDVSVTDILIPTRDGTEIDGRVFTPVSVPADYRSLMVFYHSSRWYMRGVRDDDSLFKILTPKFGCVCVSVDYRLAPESKFPVAHNDAIDSFKWVASNIEKLGANPKRGFFLGGASAGGNFVSVLSHIARDEKIKPELTGLWHMVPTLIHPADLDEETMTQFRSYKETIHAPVITPKIMDIFFENYQPTPKSPLVNPLYYPTGHKDLPPSFFQCCGWDPLRDEGIAYEKALKAAGNETRLIVYEGVPHCFWVYYPMLSLRKKYFEDAIDGFTWLLSHVKKEDD